MTKLGVFAYTEELSVVRELSDHFARHIFERDFYIPVVVVKVMGVAVGTKSKKFRSLKQLGGWAAVS